MSNLVFPMPLGGYIKHREPYTSVRADEAASGYEVRSTWQTIPRYRYTVAIDVLNAIAGGRQDFQKIHGFITRHGISLDSFLLTDPEDSAATAEVFGAGDGSTLAFQLQRTMVADADLAAPAARSYWPKYQDGYEPIFDFNGTPTLQILGFASGQGIGDGLGTRTLSTAARTNLALRSEQFDDAAWTKTNASVTANAVAAPDGNVTADKLTETNISSVVHMADQSVAVAASQTLVAVVYAQAAEKTWLYLSMLKRDAATVAGAYFDLTNGLVGNIDAGITGTSIQNCGGGWYRCTMMGSVGTGGSNPRMRVQVALANGTSVYGGTVGNGIYVWGAQCEQAATDGDYIPTTSATVARTDYSLASGLATMAVAPRLNAILGWTGNYYRRVKVAQDGLPADFIAQSMWSSGLQLVSVFV